jgi:rod shape-determining protein MreC
VTSVSTGVSEYFNSFLTLRTAQSENDQLKQEVQELRVELQSKQDLAIENERLKGLLQLKQDSKYPILPARIIGRDPSNFFNDAIINRGSADGVKLYMPIISNGAIVGRVTAVSPLTAQITLVTDERSGVGAIVGEVGNTAALGVVNGIKEKELLEMRYVPGTVEIKEGDPVFTSGQDGIYPAGLKIGEIIEVRSGSSTIHHIIYIRPSSGISSMQEVAVLLYEAPPRPKFEQSVPNAVKDEKDKTKKPAQ